MGYDLRNVLDKTYVKHGLATRLATVASITPLMVTYPENDGPQPADRLASYGPLVGDICVVLIHGGAQGRALALGKLVRGNDPGTTVPPPAGGIYSANMLPNPDMDYGTSSYTRGSFNINNIGIYPVIGFDGTGYALHCPGFDFFTSHQGPGFHGPAYPVTPGERYKTTIRIRTVWNNKPADQTVGGRYPTSELLCAIWMGCSFSSDSSDPTTGTWDSPLGDGFGGLNVTRAQEGQVVTLAWDSTVPAGYTYLNPWWLTVVTFDGAYAPSTLDLYTEIDWMSLQRRLS